MADFRVLDTTDGRVRILSAGPELEEGLRSGRFHLSSETRTVGLRDAEGNAYDVEPAQLGQALADGRFRLEDALERDQLEAQRHAEENPVEAGAVAFGANLASELTWGASDAALRNALETSGQMQLESQREASPVAGAAGTITGIVAPALLSGGTSLAASGARAVGTRALARLAPSGLSAAAGGAAERAILRHFGQGAGSRALATVTGAVTDGALSGAASAVTQANITGSPLEAEQVLSDTLFGAALGLGGGAAVAGGGAVLRGARRALRGAPDAAERAAAYAERLTNRGLGNAPEAAGAADRVAAWASGVDPEDLRLIRSNAHRAFDAEGFTRASRETAESLGALRTQLDEAGTALADATRRRAILASAAEGVDGLAARATTRTALEGAQGRLRQALGAVPDGRSASARALRGLDGELSQALGAVGDTATAGAAIGELDAVVRAVDDAAGSAGDDASRAVLTEIREALAHVAGDAGVFGGAGGRFAELDQLGRTLADARTSLAIDPRTLAEGAMQRGSEATSRTVRALEEAEAAAGSLERAGIDVAPARAALSNARERVGGALAWGELRGAAERGLAAEGGGSIRQAILHSVGGKGARLAGGAIGTLLGGPAGGAAGVALGALWDIASHPVSAYQRIAHLGDSIRGFSKRMDAGVARLDRAIRRGFLGSANPSSAVRTASRVAVGLRGSPEQRRAEYQRVSADVRALASDPEALAARTEGTIAPVADVSPQLADSMQVTAVRGVSYLAQHLPAVDRPTLFDGGELEPSQWEIDKFLRRFEAVEDPLSLFDRAAEGSLHVEHREAVEAVYPEVYSEIQARVSDLLGNAETRPPYPVRLQLGVLMGVPSDRSLQPEMIAALQSHYAQTPLQDEVIHGQRQPTPRRIDDTFSSGALSRTDEISRRL